MSELFDDYGDRVFGFGLALDALRLGGRMYRLGWNGANQYVEMQRPDEGSKMTLPYLFIRTVSGDLVPWLASQTDLLSEDWALRGKEKLPHSHSRSEDTPYAVVLDDGTFVAEFTAKEGEKAILLRSTRQIECASRVNLFYAKKLAHIPGGATIFLAGKPCL